MTAVRQDLLKDVCPFFSKPLLSILEETFEDLLFHIIDTDSQLQLYTIEHVHFNQKSLLLSSDGSLISVGVDPFQLLT